MEILMWIENHPDVWVSIERDNGVSHKYKTYLVVRMTMGLLRRVIIINKDDLYGLTVSEVLDSMYEELEKECEKWQ